MTDNEIDLIIQKIADRMNSTTIVGSNTKSKEKKKRKGLYSKIVVALCIMLAVGYTGICLLMQWVHGFQPEPQLTIAFFAFIATELWSLSKIKRSKNDNNKE